MGKIKQEPDPAEKIIRRVGENLSIDVTGDERKYRNRNGPDEITDIPKHKLKCTVCAKSIADVVKKGAHPFVHTVLGVLMCKECASFYGDGYFSADEDGDDKYCRWCGQGGTLYLCSACSCAFCKKCIKENLDKSVVKDLESDDWKCLICNPKPLFECRTICWFLQEQANKSEANDSEVDEEALSCRTKREKSKSLNAEESGSSKSRKRKASEINDKEESDKNKNVKKLKRNDSSTTSIKSRRNSNKGKHISDSESEELTNVELSSRSKRRSFSQPEQLQLTKRSSRTKNKKVEDEAMVASDNESNMKEQVAVSSKKSNTKASSSRKRSSKSPDKHPKNKGKGQAKSTSSALESSAKRSPRKSDKTSVEKKVESTITAKRSKRTSTKNISYTETNDEPVAKKSSIVSLDENSSSESESKRKGGKSNVLDKKPKLKIGKNADSEVIEGHEYISSALTDIMELSVLISSRCERLCSKVVLNNDDIFNVFHKMKLLMKGTRTNLELIEKGLNNKINEWKGDQHIDDDSNKNSVVKCDKSEQEVISCSPKEGENDSTPTDFKEKVVKSPVKANEETVMADLVKTEKENSDEVENEKHNEEKTLLETTVDENKICIHAPENLVETVKTVVKEESDSNKRLSDESENLSEETDPVDKSGEVSTLSQNNEVDDELKSSVNEDEISSKEKNEESLNETIEKNMKEEHSSKTGNAEEEIKINDVEEQTNKENNVEEQPNETNCTEEELNEKDYKSKSSAEKSEDSYEKEIKFEDLLEEKSKCLEDNDGTVESSSESNKNGFDVSLNKSLASNNDHNNSLLDESDVPVIADNKEDVDNFERDDKGNGKECDQNQGILEESGKSDEDEHTSITSDKEDFKKVDCTVEDKKDISILEDVKKSTEAKSEMTKEESKRAQSSLESQQSHTPDPQHRSTEDKGRYSHESQRRSNDRNRDWNRDRDRYQDRYQRGGSYHNNYNNRWSNSGWGYHR